MAIETIDAPVEAGTRPAWTPEEFRAVVAAGLTVTEAKALREDGYTLADALAVAEAQSASRSAVAADAHTATAKAMQKAMKPENTEHPHRSAFSYPEGDLKRPKVRAPFDVFWNGYPCYKFIETEHWRECELMADLQPGTFTVLRKDGSVMSVDVVGQRDASGNLTKVDVRFPISREEKWLVPPKIVVLYQLVRTGDPRKLFIEGTQEYMNLVMWPAA